MQDIQYLEVQARLNLAKEVFEQNQQRRDLSLVQIIDDRWTHPFIQYDSLVNYLLLTCFDKLGQPDDHLDFKSWLNTKKNPGKLEREKAVDQIDQAASPVVIAQTIYNEYQKKYGVKKSFYRFINEVLDKETQERLLSSIKIEQKTEDGQTSIIDDPEEKKLFLYESRNLFTHDLELTGSPVRGLFPDMVNVKGDKLLWSYIPVRSEKTYVYSVRKYPFELFEIISSVIGKPIEIYDFNLECRVFVEFESGDPVILENVKFSSLRDLSEINNAALRYSD